MCGKVLVREAWIFEVKNLPLTVAWAMRGFCVGQVRFTHRKCPPKSKKFQVYTSVKSNAVHQSYQSQPPDWESQ